jgi:hypothetical protein
MRCRAVVSLVVDGRGVRVCEIAATIRTFYRAGDWHGDAVLSRVLHGRRGSAIIMSGVFIGLPWRVVRELAMCVADQHGCWVVASHWDMEHDDDRVSAQAFPPKGVW